MDLALPLIVIPIAVVVILLIVDHRVSGSSRPEHSDLAEEAEHRTELPDEAVVVPLDRRGRRR